MAKIVPERPIEHKGDNAQRQKGVRSRYHLKALKHHLNLDDYRLNSNLNFALIW